MNIFFLDRDVETCAQYHCDKHVVKMILETAQLLSSVHHMTGNPSGYKLTHKNHPCAVWARSSMDNYFWLHSLGLLLGEEYTYRYGKVHKSVGVIERLPTPALADIGFSDPPKCVTDDLKAIPDVVEAYRAYYCRDKRDICIWSKREKPYWFK